MRLVRDAGLILTKNSIMGKAIGIMGELSGRYREIWGECFSGGIGGSRGDAVILGAGDNAGIAPGDPRVSRGENYRGLPWVMLDYPRVWGREDVFAIRTMFLWGHAFSVTLHLKGRYQQLYLPGILRRRQELAAAGFYAGVNADEWRHEHTEDVFRPMDEVEAERLGDGGFLKLSAAVELDRWPEARDLLAELFSMLVSVLGKYNQLPSR